MRVMSAPLGRAGGMWLTSGRCSVVRRYLLGVFVGGSSATNNVMALRGQPGDYDAWARTGNAGWSYEQLLQAFLRVEHDLDFGDHREHGASGPVPIGRYGSNELPAHERAFLQACVTAGHPDIADHNAHAAVGAGPLPLNAVAGMRQSTALTYLASARARTNLSVWPETIVDRVLLDQARATGVRLADGRDVAAREVLLAAGTYASPTILLRSGIGPAAHLRELRIPLHRDLPGVGANLHDHPLLRLQFTAQGEPQPTPCPTLLTTRSDPELTRPDLQIFPSAITAGETGPELSLLVALLQPHSRGQLRLASPDPDIAPDIDVGLLTHPEDLPRLRTGLRQARHLTGSAPFSEHLGTELRPSSERAGPRTPGWPPIIAGQQHDPNTMGPPGTRHHPSEQHPTTAQNHGEHQACALALASRRPYPKWGAVHVESREWSIRSHTEEWMVSWSRSIGATERTSFICRPTGPTYC